MSVSFITPGSVSLCKLVERLSEGMLDLPLVPSGLSFAEKTLMLKKKTPRTKSATDVLPSKVPPFLCGCHILGG